MALGFFAPTNLKKLFENLDKLDKEQLESRIVKICAYSPSQDILRYIEENFFSDGPEATFIYLEIIKRIQLPESISFLKKICQSKVPASIAPKILDCLEVIKNEECAALLLYCYLNWDPQHREKVGKILFFMEETAIWPLFEALLRIEDLELKEYIGNLIHKIDGEKKLVIALNSNDWEKKRRALLLVRDLENPDLVPYLTNILLENNSQLNPLAIQSLEKIVDAKNVKQILRNYHRFHKAIALSIEKLITENLKTLNTGLLKALPNLKNPATCQMLLKHVQVQNIELLPELVQISDHSLDFVRQFVIKSLKCFIQQLLNRHKPDEKIMQKFSTLLIQKIRKKPHSTIILKDIIFSLGQIFPKIILKLLVELNNNARPDLGRFLARLQPEAKNAFFKRVITENDKKIQKTGMELLMIQKD
ncbi:hypothetical protein ACFL35_16905, partial [Candidatus Riflebacteria bacterium]